MCGLSPASPNLTVDIPLFHSLFQGLIEVKNIKIFNTGKFIQAFVEVNTEEEGRKAIRSLHKKKLNIGRLKVYFSNKKNITFSKSLEEALKDSRSTEGESIQKNEFEWRNNGKEKQGRKEYKKTPVTHAKSLNIAEPVSKSVSIKKYLTYHDLGKLNRFKNKTNNNKSPSRQETHPRGNRFTIRAEPINSSKVDCDMLCNLFSQFGPVRRVAIDTINNFAIIELGSEEAWESVQEGLGGIIFFGLPLFIKKIGKAELLDKGHQKHVHSKVIESFGQLVGDRALLGEKKVTRWLLASNLSPETSPVHLRELLAVFHDPVKIVKIRDSLNKILFVLEFSSEKQAIETISVMQGRVVNRSSIRLAFTSEHL